MPVKEKEKILELPKLKIPEVAAKEWKKAPLLREMKALGNGYDSGEARRMYVQKHLSKHLKDCRKPNSDNWYCDRDDSSGALVSTQRRDNNPDYDHLQCSLVYYRDHTDWYPDLSELTQSLDTPLLHHWH